MPVPLEIVATANVSQATAGLQGLGNEVSHVGTTMGGAQGKGDGFFGGILGGAAKLGLAVTGIGALAQGVGGLATGMIAGNAQMENYAAQFEVLTGSAANAATLMNQLKVMGAKTPFEFTDLAAGTQTLLAFGVAQRDILPDLQMLGDISGGNANKLHSLSLVFGQVASQGKMMGGDLLQMINAGFNPLNVISQKTGRSMSDLRDDMSKGLITYDMVKDAMVTATSAGGQFAGMMDKQAATFDGMTSTLSDDMGSLQRTMMTPIFDVLKSSLAGLLPMLEGEQFQSFATAFATNVAGVIPIVVNLLSGLFSLLQTGWGIIQPFVSTAIQMAESFMGIATGADRLTVASVMMLGPLASIANAFSILQDGMAEVLAGFSAGGLQGAFEALVANIPTFLSGLQQIGQGIITQAVQWGMALVDWIAPMVPGLVQGIADFFGAMFTWITGTGIPQAVAFLLQLGDTLISWIGPKIPGMLAQLADWGTALLGWVLNTGIPGLVNALVGAATALIAWIGPKIPDLLAGLATFGAALWGWVTQTALPMIITKLGEWGSAFLAWVGPQIPPLLAQLGTLLGQLGAWFMNTALPNIVTQLAAWGQAFLDWVGPQVVPLIANLAGLLAQLGTWFVTQGLPLIVAKTGEWGGKLIQWVADSIPGLMSNLGTFLTDFGNWASNSALPAVLHAMSQVGESIIDGILRGLGMNPGAIKDYILGLARDAEEAIKNFFGIHSPSQLMIDLWGPRGVTGGMVAGLAQGAAGVVGQAGQIAAAAGDALTIPAPVFFGPGSAPEKAALAAALSGGGGVAGTGAAGAGPGGGLPRIVINLIQTGPAAWAAQASEALEMDVVLRTGGGYAG